MADRTFDFDPAYWEAAQSLIEAEEHKKRRGFLWWWGLGALLLLVGGGIAWAVSNAAAGPPPTEVHARHSSVPAWSLAWTIDTLCAAQTDCPPSGFSPTRVLIASGQTPKSPKESTASNPSQSASYPDRATPLLASLTVAESGKGLKTDPALFEQQSGNDPDPFAPPRIAIGSDRGMPVGQQESVKPERAILASLSTLDPRPYALDMRLIRDFYRLEDAPQMWRSPRSFLRLEIGGSLNQDWQALPDSASNGLNLAQPTFQAGLIWSQQFSGMRRFGFQTGLRYRARTGLANQRQINRTQFSFGFTRDEYVLSPESMHWLEIPLNLQVFIDRRSMAPKHSIQLGISAFRLLNVQSTLEQQVVSDLGTSERTSETLWGAKEGFAPWSGNVHLGYTWRFRRRWYLGAEAQMGLQDLTDNAFFENETQNLNHQLSLRLGFDLLQR